MIIKDVLQNKNQEYKWKNITSNCTSERSVCGSSLRMNFKLWVSTIVNERMMLVLFGLNDSDEENKDYCGDEREEEQDCDLQMFFVVIL